jgi:hypothetical protein
MRAEASIGRCEEALRVCVATTITAIIPPARSQRLAAASTSGCVAGKPSEERTGHRAKISA